MLLLTSYTGDEDRRGEVQSKYATFPADVVLSVGVMAWPCLGQCGYGRHDSKRHTRAQAGEGGIH